MSPLTRSRTKQKTTPCSSSTTQTEAIKLPPSSTRNLKMKSRTRKKITDVAVAVATIATVATTATSFSSTSVMTTSPYFTQSTNKPTTLAKPNIKMTLDHDSSSSSHHKSNQDKKTLDDIASNRETTTITTTPRTQSFGALWAGSIEKNNINNNNITPHVPQVHTLILGTHPSIKSLNASQYFAHPMNAFWWIAGDCLGFRRDTGLSSSSSSSGKNKKPYKFTSSLRYDADAIIPYESQVQTLASKGFALWDVVASCERKGSLDAAIQREVANDIRGFCDEHRESLKRIVFANGKSGCGFFTKHFKDWWSVEGELMPEQRDGGVSNKAFGKKYGMRMEGRITCVCALAVSPAAAAYTYEEKRDYWERYCYKPGLDDHYRLEMMSRSKRVE